MTQPTERNERADLRSEAWLQRSLALLDASADALDAATLSRLNRARQLALVQGPVMRRNWLLGSGLAGAAVALMIVLGIAARHGNDPIMPAAGGDDGADVVAVVDDLDLYQDLDFYQWLDQQQGGDG